MLDAQLLAQVYIELTGGRQIGLGLGAEAARVEAEATKATISRTREARPARPHSASEEELARHREFTGKMTDPLWERFAAPI